MSKRKAADDPVVPPIAEPARNPWPLWAKALASVLIALHLSAVFVGPFAFASSVGGSSSPFADAMMGALRPYIVALYLDHGYFFFAPNPGSSRLVDYRVEFADGRPEVKGRFPDLATERPRLLYHRHFMLSEALSNRYVPPSPPPEPTPPALTASSAERAAFQFAKVDHSRAVAMWQRQRGQYEAMRTSIEQHLLAKHGGEKVMLTRIEHRLAPPDEVQSGNRALDAEDSYFQLPESLQEAIR